MLKLHWVIKNSKVVFCFCGKSDRKC
uniref:Uncharacterized protein n=1 Tax=Anguilla anguilla TaxID=7936 RepID=A0A0E9UUQ4_ANGAN